MGIVRTVRTSGRWCAAHRALRVRWAWVTGEPTGLVRGASRNRDVEHAMRMLSNYAIKPDAEAFILRLEDETGEAVEFIVSAEQLEALIEIGDELLEEDDVADDPAS